jgi:hypothetical protein
MIYSQEMKIPCAWLHNGHTCLASPLVKKNIVPAHVIVNGNSGSVQHISFVELYELKVWSIKFQV